MIEAEAAAHSGCALSSNVPREAEARLGQKEGTIFGESGVADVRLGLEHSVHEKVIRGAVVGFIPSVGGLDAEAGAEFKTGSSFDGVLNEAGAFKRAPVERRRRQHNGEGFYLALQESGEGTERCLTVLILGEVVVGLNLLEPEAGFELMASA